MRENIGNAVDSKIGIAYSSPIEQGSPHVNAILDMLSRDPNVAPAFKAAIVQPTFFRGSHGRRRQYLSQRDADAYDRGFCGWPTMPACVVDGRGGPEADGYHDADTEQEERDDAPFDVGCEFDGKVHA